ncbi:MAG: type II secretion system protein GspG [Epsilonproteobacteria bacterium]|nr:MAG: type II secretion system protein GspG [Campylobacterota bacterium]
MKKNKIKRINQKKAFSLMELMIVIVILGMLSALILPNIMGKADDAKVKLTCIQMKNIQEALKSFKFDNGTYPDNEMGLKALVKNPDEELFLNYPNSGYFEGDSIPKDPWKGRYIYTNEEGNINLISLGGDGKEGGEDNAKDISMKSCEK